MLDITLLQCIKRREDYDYYRPMVRDHLIDDRTKTLLYDFKAYFDEYSGHSEINFDVFPTWWRQFRHPNIKKDELEFYEKVFKRIQESPDEESALKLRENLQDLHFATVVANKAHDTIDGKITGEQFLLAVQDELDKTMTERAKTGDVPWDTRSIVETVDSLSYEHGLKFKLKCLDKSLGSLHAGKFGIVGAYVDCYAEGTQILSDYGWKDMADLTYNDKVAQYHPDGSISFVHPEDISAVYYEGEMHHYTDSLGRFDLLVTPNHRMARRHKNRGFENVRSYDIKPSKNEHKWLVAGDAVGNRELTFYERFLIAYQADGSAERSGCTGARGHVTVRFTIKKERKKERLRWILDNTTLEYHEVIEKTRDTHSTFYVKVPNTLPKDFSWVRTSNISSIYAKQFVDEASYWDCHRQRDNLFDFRSTNKNVIDTLQALCALGGMHSNYHVIKDKRSDKYSDVYVLSVRTHHIGVSERTINKEIVDYSGNVYCVKVPSGNVVVRYNNVTAISGNSGKSTFLADQYVAGMLRQIVDENNKDKWFYSRPIMWFNNEGGTGEIKMYCLQSLWGVSYDRIQKNPQKVEEAFNKITGGKDLMNIIPCQGWHIKEAERYIKMYKPAVVIYDMLDNFSGFESEGTVDQRFRDLYDYARQMSVKYDHTAVGTSQCTGEANGLERIEMHLLAGSRVAKQSTADYIITIGRSLEMGKQGFRYIYTPKNKLQAQQTDDFDRYTNQEVIFRGDIKRFIDPPTNNEEAF